MSDPDVRDPLGLRDVIRCVQVIEGYVDPGAALSKGQVVELKSLVEQFLESLEALDVIVTVDGPLSELAARLLALGQAFARGEGEKRDETGFLVMGAMAPELADHLYKYATED